MKWEMKKKTRTSNFNCFQVKVLLARASWFKRLLCGFPVTWKCLLTLWNNPQDISTSAFLSYIWNFRNWNRFFVAESNDLYNLLASVHPRKLLSFCWNKYLFKLLSVPCFVLLKRNCDNHFRRILTCHRKCRIL